MCAEYCARLLFIFDFFLRPFTTFLAQHCLCILIVPVLGPVVVSPRSLSPKPSRKGSFPILNDPHICVDSPPMEGLPPLSGRKHEKMLQRIASAGEGLQQQLPTQVNFCPSADVALNTLGAFNAPFPRADYPHIALKNLLSEDVEQLNF